MTTPPMPAADQREALLDALVEAITGQPYFVVSAWDCRARLDRVLDGFTVKAKPPRKDRSQLPQVKDIRGLFATRSQDDE
jgi:hypothetical protein